MVRLPPSVESTAADTGRDHHQSADASAVGGATRSRSSSSRSKSGCLANGVSDRATPSLNPGKTRKEIATAVWPR